jgi:predicted ATPase
MEAKMKEQIQERILQGIRLEKRIIPHINYDENEIFKKVILFGLAFDKKFKIDSDNKKAIYGLIHYFFGNKMEAEKYSIDLKKGLMIRGNIGTGKSLLMKIFQQLMYFYNRELNQYYQFIDTSRVREEFVISGYSGTEKYTKKNCRNSIPNIWCFDDLGLEGTVAKYFGSETNIMADILYHRYNLWSHFRIPTFITTNLLPSQIEELYGDRLRSRFHEMFNDIVLDGKDRRYNS